MSRRSLDLTDQKFGKLTYVKQIKNNTNTTGVMWLCKCDCGKQTENPTSQRFHKTSCGCKRLDKVLDLTGHRFGKLVYLKSIRQSPEGFIWLCQCDCGEQTETLASRHLYKVSCGCARNDQILDLVGHRFGNLVYVKKLGRKYNQILWLCQCDCGETCKVTAGNRKNTKSCSSSCPTHSKSAVARKTGLWNCPKHGQIKAAKVAHNCFECPKCRNIRAGKKRRGLKQKAINYAGGCCQLCGYDTCNGALEFHHLDASKKDFSITSTGKSWKSIKKEIDKCLLLCANCHREVHAGLREVPDVQKYDE